jgi:hypothetical protein
MMSCTVLMHNAVADDDSNRPTSFVQTSEYVNRNIEGWTVRINRHLLSDESDIGGPAISLLTEKLKYIRQVVPGPACVKLQKVPIFLGVNDGHAPCSEYHPSREWLASHGYNPDKAKCFEIGNAKLFVEWSKDQPMMVLHELSHAYNDQVLGWDNSKINEAYQHALQTHLYDSVPYFDGTKKRAYALNDQHEFFAEASEAYFGRNDFYPFTRQELQQYDPTTYSIVKELWENPL